MIEAHTEYVTSVEFSSDGSFVVSGSDDKSIKVWDWVKKNEIYKFQGHIEYVTCAKFSTDDRYVVSGSYDNSIRVWDLQNPNKPATVLNHHSAPVSSIDFSQNNQFFVS